MIKKSLLITVCLVASVMLICSPAFSQKVVELTVNDHNPEMSPPSQALKHWAKMLEEEAGGKLKLNLHHGGALLKGDEVYRGVQSGIADMGHYVVDRQEGFLLNTVIALPFMGWPDQDATAEIYQKLLDKFPEMVAEWKGVKVIVFMMMPPTFIHTSKKLVRTPADLKGMKLHGAEHALVRTMSAAGATPVNMDIADMYMSLDRGLIEGVMNHFNVLAVFGVIELLKNHSMFGKGGINMTPMYVIMNSYSFDKLPPDLHKLILGSGHYWYDRFMEMDLADQVTNVENCKKWNHEFAYLSDAEIAEWQKLAKGPVHDTWIEAAEAKGLPGKAVYDAALDLISQYK